MNLTQYDLDKLISDLLLQGYSKQEINDYINELESEEQSEWKSKN